MKMEIYFLLLIVNFNCTLRTSALHASPGKVGKLLSDVRWPLKARDSVSGVVYPTEAVSKPRKNLFLAIICTYHISLKRRISDMLVCVRDETFQEKWDENQNPEFPVPLPDEVFLTQRFCFIIWRGLLRGPLLCFFKMKKNQRKLNLIKKNHVQSHCVRSGRSFGAKFSASGFVCYHYERCAVQMCGGNWLTWIMPSMTLLNSYRI